LSSFLAVLDGPGSGSSGSSGGGVFSKKLRFTDGSNESRRARAFFDAFRLLRSGELEAFLLPNVLKVRESWLF